jgi:hypothetical protein
MFFKSAISRVSDSPFKDRLKIDFAKIQKKRYGKETIHAANPDKLTEEVAKTIMKSNTEVTHEGYYGMLGSRVSESSGFLDPLVISLATNFIPKRNFPEMAMRLRSRDDLDAISLLKISENFSSHFKPYEEKKFFEKSFRKFHGLLGDLTALESIKLAKVIIKFSSFNFQVLESRNFHDYVLLSRISRKVAAGASSLSFENLAEISEIFAKLNFRDVSLFRAISSKIEKEGTSEFRDRIRNAWVTLDVDVSSLHL